MVVVQMTVVHRRVERLVPATKGGLNCSAPKSSVPPSLVHHSRTPPALRCSSYPLPQHCTRNRRRHGTNSADILAGSHHRSGIGGSMELQVAGLHHVRRPASSSYGCGQDSCSTRAGRGRHRALLSTTNERGPVHTPGLPSRSWCPLPAAHSGSLGRLHSRCSCSRAAGRQTVTAVAAATVQATTGRYQEAAVGATNVPAGIPSLHPPDPNPYAHLSAVRYINHIVFEALQRTPGENSKQKWDGGKEKWEGQVQSRHAAFHSHAQRQRPCPPTSSLPKSKCKAKGVSRPAKQQRQYVHR